LVQEALTPCADRRFVDADALRHLSIRDTVCCEQNGSRSLGKLL